MLEIVQKTNSKWTLNVMGAVEACVFTKSSPSPSSARQSSLKFKRASRIE